MKKFIKLIISLILIIFIFIYLYQNNSKILTYNQQEINKGIEIIKSKTLNIIGQKNFKVKFIKENNEDNENNKNNENITNNIEYKNGDITYIDTNGKEFTGIGTITLRYKNDNITILDRNLGATTNNIDNPDSYGYYFQWGNNYGFSTNTGNINTQKEQIDITGYGPSQYSNSIFIIGEYGERISINTDDNTKFNLWGGGLDSKENNRGTKNNDYTQKSRQGPCPNGYHVPSPGERNILLESWIEIYTGQGYKLNCLFSGAEGLKMISFNDHCNEKTFVNNFITTFKIPLAGSIVYHNLYHNNLTNYWTSTYRRSFGVGKRYINPHRHPTYSDAMPIRCFSDNNKYNY